MKRKIITRITPFIFIFALAFTLLIPIRASAEERTNAEEETGISADETNASLYENGEAQSNSSQNAEVKNNSSEGNADEIQDDGFFPQLYEAFEANLSQILSALAFIGSLIIMLCYKKGLLPIVTDGIKALAGGVKLIGEKTEGFKTEAEALCNNIDKRLSAAEQMARLTASSLEDIKNKLDVNAVEKNEIKKLNAVLLGQIDMLYDIFNATALPQYLKDNVGQRIADMKSTLASEENFNDKN